MLGHNGKFTCVRCGEHCDVLRTIRIDDSTYAAYPNRYLISSGMVDNIKINVEKLCYECNISEAPLSVKGRTITINGSNDLGLTHREYIGKTVMVIRVKKNGLWLCKLDDGDIISIPKYNLNIKDT